MSRARTSANGRKPSQDAGVEIHHFTHRTVPAAGQPAPVTTAARSVFDVARDAEEARPADRRGAKKPRLPPLDLSAIEVERAVPVPLKGAGGGKASRYAPLLQKLTEPGLSVAFPARYKGAVATAARAWAKAHGVKFTLHKTGDDECRLWRVA